MEWVIVLLFAGCFAGVAWYVVGGVKIERKVKTLTAQGRMQGLIVSAMPIFLGLVMTLIKPGLMIPYLTSPMGMLSVLVMCVLIFVGWLMIRKIIKIDV